MLKVLLATSLFAVPDARFEIFPTEGNVISIGCDSDDDDECRMEDYSIKSISNYYSKTKRFPGLTNAPKEVLGAINAAAEAMGEVDYVHVAVTLNGTTYEYMYDRNSGWNSFRAIPQTKKCRLECKLKPTGENQ